MRATYISKMGSPSELINTVFRPPIAVRMSSRSACQFRASCEWFEVVQKTVTVLVQHEEVRLKRGPTSDGQTGGEISEDEQVVTLNKEVLVLDKQTVATEWLV